MATAKKNTRGNKEKNCCGGCSKDVGVDEKALICSICDIWYHIKCERVSVADYDLLQRSDDSIQWYCKTCKGASQKLYKMITLIHKRQDLLETELKSLSSIVSGCNESLGTQSKLFKDLDLKVTSMNKELPDLISEKVSEILADKQEEEEREDNLMFFNLDERREENESNGDLELVKEVCRNVLGISFHLQIEDVTRLGNRDKADVAERPRPLRVKMPNRKERGTILKNAYKLKNNEEFRKVGISRDLTKKQREVNKMLRKELLRLKKDRPECSWAIRRDKIVEVPSRVEVPRHAAASTGVASAGD